MDIKIYKICKFLHDINISNFGEIKNNLSNFICDEKEIECHFANNNDSNDFAFSYSNIENNYFNSFYILNKPSPFINVTVSNIQINFVTKLTILFKNGIYQIESSQSDRAHGYRKLIEKEFDWIDSTVESIQILDILENGRDQIFIGDKILDLLK